jgi:hypothetical protein
MIPLVGLTNLTFLSHKHCAPDPDDDGDDEGDTDDDDD